MIFLGFTCAVFLAAGLLAAAYVTADDFEGHWLCTGTMEENRFVPFPPQVIQNEIIIRDDQIEYYINGDQVSATYSRRRIRVELAAQICMEYRLSMEEGRMIVTDQHGMRMVYERIGDEEPGLERESDYKE